MAPIQKPHRSKQDYQTPKEFLDAVRCRLGIEDFLLDVAADTKNAVAPMFYDEATDGLKQSWNMGNGWTWCNPPYSNISPWVAKAFKETVSNGAKTAMLIPASVGANWWRDYVHEMAHVIFLNGRISFDGIAPYPKDCALLLYTPYTVGGYEVWSWRQNA
jgi:phage N-6-adenine-methyltransferase